MWSVRDRGAFSRFSAILSPIISTAIRYPRVITPTYFIFQLIGLKRLTLEEIAMILHQLDLQRNAL